MPIIAALQSEAADRGYLGERLRARQAGRSRHHRPPRRSPAPFRSSPAPPRPASPRRRREPGPAGAVPRGEHGSGTGSVIGTGGGSVSAGTGRVVSPGRPDRLRGSLAAVAPRGAAAGAWGEEEARTPHPAPRIPPWSPRGERSTECGSGCRHSLGWAGNQRQESHRRLGTGNPLRGNLGVRDTWLKGVLRGRGN
uniref:uncharacterized protein n=1 Tax=Lonchura striata TaxID=40157 RepID=UPI001292CEB5|nr:uncharacterized protein LOC116184211 [Lonchura striata domestica]